MSEKMYPNGIHTLLTFFFLLFEILHTPLTSIAVYFRYIYIALKVILL